MAVFFGGGVWVSLDLEAAAVVVSVEGCCWRVSLCWCLFADAGEVSRTLEGVVVAVFVRRCRRGVGEGVTGGRCSCKQW